MVSIKKMRTFQQQVHLISCCARNAMISLAVNWAQNSWMLGCRFWALYARFVVSNLFNAFDAETAEFAVIESKEHRNMKPKNTICLWFDKDAQEAARFYAATFPDSKVTAVHKAPGDYPGGKQGDVLTVEFTVLGIPCLGLNGGPNFKHSEAFSFQIATDNQEETDRYWNAIVGNGGKESQCGWCKDRWGLSWQITPRALTDALAAGGAEAKRAFEAMMPMNKIDIATIEAARRA